MLVAWLVMVFPALRSQQPPGSTLAAHSETEPRSYERTKSPGLTDITQPQFDGFCMGRILVGMGYVSTKP